MAQSRRLVILAGSGEITTLLDNETTSAPTVNDDGTAGYAIGSVWHNTSTDKSYICLDTTTGAAVWKETTATGTGTGDVVGPSSATDEAIARFDTGTGKLIQNSIPKIDDSGRVTLVETLTFNDEHDNGSQSGGWTLNWGNGQKQKVTLTGSGTITITDPSPAKPGHFTLRVIQDGTGLRQPTWPSKVKWPNGIVQQPSLLANSICLFTLYFDGTNYYAEQSGGLAGFS